MKDQKIQPCAAILEPRAQSPPREDLRDKVNSSKAQDDGEIQMISFAIQASKGQHRDNQEDC